MTKHIRFHEARAADKGGIRVTTPGRTELLSDLESRFRDGHGFSVATLNLDHVVKMGRDSVFRAAYGVQSHVVADGNPIVWLSRLAGRPVELVPGSELIEPLVALAGRLSVPVALVGSTREVLDLAARRLEARHPGLRIVARFAPRMGFDPAGPEADALFDNLAASEARLVLLALGAPKQEVLAARGAARLPAAGFVSIGAGLDFIAGAQVRAPVWVRRIAMEWAWRMLSDPRRLAGRYAACLAVLPGLTVAALRERLTRKADEDAAPR
ncbi:WecB/TagA/CpsF family glycosyltransferase [Rhodobacter sp. CZR27]|uniref:WecB/TagA/CpsF family glycosyltransferase n=1 Tax=Rhodobacter sp. CZR27 TaxID=2033869 RepID=UPI000BBF30CA|nr:WecB/TagA/CpsF family glycosyltransferase [Rhodobacter sp. CZR27]